MILDLVKLIVKTKHLVCVCEGSVMRFRAPRCQEGVNAEDTDVMRVKAGTTGLRAGKDTKEAGWIRTSGQLRECRIPSS